ncbi:CCA tRNA nucleotidyltransferase [Lichenihabitans psoromatis]|uniref:CCA tRNA nucleotidyltransferase n=1 Tax=Lichenihabitans psoromatis TaxID=2528642 RepID=UPI001FE1D403|nr:CCA tRNA nucleotidyltransferase [Lichenihabitans psoromatis]
MTEREGFSRPLRLDASGRLADVAFLAEPALARALALLNQDGEEARVVGGAVRNALLGLPAGDIDIATTALPDIVVARAKAAGLRPLPTGIAHGTITVMVGRAGFEVTTLREDVETDGRHAIVRFGRDFTADAQRRDFTVNALSLSADGTVHDTTDGLADLAAGRVRFIGEADRRIREDYLRVLRFFRFSATYAEGPLDPEGLRAATLHRDALTRLSRERIRVEVLKLLVAPRAAEVTTSMDKAGIARVIFGGACDPLRLVRLIAIETARQDSPDAILRLAALAVRTEADVARLREQLRLSNDEANRLAAAAHVRGGLDPEAVPTHAGLLALLFDHGRRAALDGVSLAEVDAKGNGSRWTEAYGVVTTAAEPKLPLGGADVMARGVHSGRDVGIVLKQFRQEWVAAGFPSDPIVVAGLLDAIVASHLADD